MGETGVTSQRSRGGDGGLRKREREIDSERPRREGLEIARSARPDTELLDEENPEAGQEK